MSVVAVTAKFAYPPVLLAQLRKSKITDHKLMNEPDLNATPKPVNFARIRVLQDQIAELKKRWPAHSTPPAMMQRLDELEEELENELALCQ
jgi:hypothetical protein